VTWRRSSGALSVVPSVAAGPWPDQVKSSNPMTVTLSQVPVGRRAPRRQA
jgi:hypothetical protein